MDRSAIPRQKGDYKLADLEGECMLYDGAGGKALYLNDTASVIWKLCDGQRTVESIASLLGDAFPEAGDLHGDLDETFRFLMDHGALEIP
jgi:hypothetical protein